MLVEPKNKQYKVLADLDDWRDFLYTPQLTPLRSIVDLRPWASPVEDQGHLGSCIGNTVAGAYELLLKKNIPDNFVDISRLFVYYNARLLENTEREDSGAYIRDGVKAAKKYGLCSEKVWPYLINHFNITPSVESYDDAKHRNIKNYYRIATLEDTLDALNHDHPVVFGLKVFEGFNNIEYTKDYILEIPNPEEQPIGGHAMMMAGYDLNRQLVLCRNSFGPDWCMGGYCWIPFEYMRNETFDSWIFEVDLIDS